MPTPPSTSSPRTAYVRSARCCWPAERGGTQSLTPSPPQEVDYRGKITRQEFETLCADTFARTMRPLETALEQAGYTKASEPSPLGVLASSSDPAWTPG
jgi:molecular chaperone DnaK (HSP70)